MKIKINDKVRITKGKDRNKEGKVLQVFTKANKLVVEGLNLMKKNLRPRKQGEKGQIIELSAPVRVANVMLLCPKCAKAARVGYKKDGVVKKRVCRKCNEFID